MTYRWRTIDIVIASIIAVTFGVIFWAWNIVWGATEGAFAFFPPAQTLLYGVWLIPAVLAGLIIRKPGAAVFTEVLAATVSALLGAKWGLLTLEAGLVQGLGAEIVFLLFLYRRWNLPVALLAGAGAGLFGAVNDLILWYPGSGPAFASIYVASSIVSGAVIAGGLSWVLARAIARTGALSRFASGREAARV